jgi:starch phosphorylase
VRAFRRLTVRPVLPPALTALTELAGNLRWTWHPATQDLFATIDPQTWITSDHDPVAVLGQASRERLAALAADAGYVGRVDAAHADLRAYLEDEKWFGRLEGDKPAGIAYFSPEFGVDATLPQYSGGLGILAGDHLKAASDLGVPLIAVGLLYRHGYFKQSLSAEGWQQERYAVTDPDNTPLTLLRESDGTAARVRVGLPGGRILHAAIWIAAVGRVPLLMLDSTIEDNEPAEREVTDRLYGGNAEHRLLQELLLGVGGVRALRTYCRITGAPTPEVFHTNEGHAGFLGIERIREYIADHGLDYDSALEITRAGTVFTTHTPVPAGIDRFPRDLIEQHFGGDTDIAAGGVPVDKVVALGAEDYPGGDGSMFNMAVMGLRLGQRANGVSLLHGEVSRGMFSGLWPGFDTSEVPITSVTNGVHAPTWMSPDLFAAVGRDTEKSETDPEAAFADLAALPDDEIWALRRTLRSRLVADARFRLRASWEMRGASPAELGWVETTLDPDVLTIGFARRVPSYKRLTLMLRDPERLSALLNHPERPVQIVVAGKSHPADEGGKELIQQLVQFSDERSVRKRIIFLPDYDMRLAAPLVAGVDVWLNNPLRPLEACGTSGMKAALNGGLNLSIRDGWWDEWFDGDNGWAIPSATVVGDQDRRDDIEAHALYDLIEHQVAPRFYDRTTSELPSRWLEMVRHTWTSLGPRAQATRMVAEYVQRLYTPAAVGSRALNASFDGARELAQWKKKVRSHWSQVAVEHVESELADENVQLGGSFGVTAYVRLGDLSPGDVDVTVLTGRVDDHDDLHDQQTVSLTLSESFEGGRHRFVGDVAADRTGPFGYTVRIVPAHRWLAGPAEMGLAVSPEEG